MIAPNARILCVGAAHWDIIGRAGGAVQYGDDLPGQIERRPGGVALNVALGLARRGCAVGLCAVVGDDLAGASLIRHAESAGVDCTSVARIEGSATSQYLAIEDGDGDLIAAIADTNLLEARAEDLADRSRPTIESAGTVLLEANLPASVIGRFAEIATQTGAEIVANPVSPAKAHRLKGLLTGRSRPTIVANLAEANVLLGGDHETTQEAAETLYRAGAGLALVSDGPRPAALVTKSCDVALRPAVLTKGFSVTGAGDALLSAFLACPERRTSPRLALAEAMLAARDHMARRR